MQWSRCVVVTLHTNAKRWGHKLLDWKEKGGDEPRRQQRRPCHNIRPAACRLSPG
jgi:hypothetical protein